MKKPDAFSEAKPRTPKGEARQREIKAMKGMEELLNLDAEEDLKRNLAEKYQMLPGDPRFDRVLAI